MSVCPVKELSSMCAAGRETAPSPAMMRTPMPVGGSACASLLNDDDDDDDAL
jgi:hypothetical protein